MDNKSIIHIRLANVISLFAEYYLIRKKSNFSTYISSIFHMVYCLFNFLIKTL